MYRRIQIKEVKTMDKFLENMMDGFALISGDVEAVRYVVEKWRNQDE